MQTPGHAIWGLKQVEEGPHKVSSSREKMSVTLAVPSLSLSGGRGHKRERRDKSNKRYFISLWEKTLQSSFLGTSYKHDKSLDKEGVICKSGLPEVASEKEDMLGYSVKKLGS